MICQGEAFPVYNLLAFKEQCLRTGQLLTYTHTAKHLWTSDCSVMKCVSMWTDTCISAFWINTLHPSPSSLKMEAARLKMLLYIYKTTWYHKTECYNLRNQCEPQKLCSINFTVLFMIWIIKFHELITSLRIQLAWNAGSYFREQWFHSITEPVGQSPFLCLQHKPDRTYVYINNSRTTANITNYFIPYFIIVN
jgi:hypothetical protein